MFKQIYAAFSFSLLVTRGEHARLSVSSQINAE